MASEIAESFGDLLDCAGHEKKKKQEEEQEQEHQQPQQERKDVEVSVWPAPPPPHPYHPLTPPHARPAHLPYYGWMSFRPVWQVCFAFCVVVSAAAALGFHYRSEGRRQPRPTGRPPPTITHTPTPTAPPSHPCGNLCQIRRQPQMARKTYQKLYQDQDKGCLVSRGGQTVRPKENK